MLISPYRTKTNGLVRGLLCALFTWVRQAHPKNSKDSDTIDIWSIDKQVRMETPYKHPCAHCMLDDFQAAGCLYGKWQAWLTPARLSVPRKKLTAVSLLDEAVFFAGGFVSGCHSSPSCGYRKFSLFLSASIVSFTARKAPVFPVFLCCRNILLAESRWRLICLVA
eukprot:COSAG05_NODE_138_length_16837_cov_344.961286_6_plen_166_part_00